MEPDRPRVIDVAPDPSPPERRQWWALVFSAAATLLFLGVGAAVVSSAVAYRFAGGPPIERSLVVALLLNMALILFGWFRHRALSEEVRLRAAAEERAQLLAARDPLTGFLNRRSLGESGAALLSFAARRKMAVALLIVDLDHFKTVNDMHGHVAGDAVLRSVAIGIAAAMPPAALTARFGGDEFACAFVFDARHPETVDAIARRLVESLAQPVEADGLRCHITASIGIARSDSDGATIDALMRSADIAMYGAKKGGRNRYAWFDRAMERALNDRNDVESGLRIAIPAGQVTPCFEAQVDLASGRLTGFEVLARWTHPTHGEITPDRFIPVAEETGLIGDLSLSIMRQAFAAARDWDPGLSLSINISPVQLRDAWLAQKIIKATIEAGFAPNRLEVEITESALFDNLALAQSIIGSLKNQGVRVALDDFGTGYSSLAHLRALPFDRIKIDKSFVLSLLDSADSAAIVKAIIGLGDSLNLPVTAEGIESAAIAERLAALGCVKGQGWAYGRPTSIADTRRMLGARGLLRGGSDPDVPTITSRRLVG
ncbi:diguanylate cyclase [Sphingomonas sp. Leaf407]|uniref:putative bifunctional diguanylate cyclase/phosphodiesterase n=1 Tax=unclassified Sphingomonas TaxID=196159 RepID=UPI0006FC9CB1|nr:MULTISPECIES: EAL domain-containing protein [unclassified Sphingomonas]KQN37592.1 diguanylate cyclase [Sphingomonas sp. Leaf42]KQT27959.1 diguanylate cyclase [Sphingomonas sp. Leaf407]